MNTDPRPSQRSAFRPVPADRRRGDLRRLARAYEWGGISQRDMGRLLAEAWSRAGPIHLDAALSLEELEAAGAKMLGNARAVLRATRAFGVAPEVPRGLELGTRLELERPFSPPGFDHTVRAGGKSPFLGPVVEPVHWTQALLEVAGLLKRSPLGFEVSRKGEKLLDRARAGELYAHLFRTFFRRFNLAYLDRWPELPELQDMAPHWIWVLTGPLGTDFTSADMYVQVFIPRPLVDAFEARAAPARLRHLIQTRVLDLLADFGLLEPQPGDDETEELGDVCFRPTPLFRRFLRMDIPPDVPTPHPHLRLLP